VLVLIICTELILGQHWGKKEHQPQRWTEMEQQRKEISNTGICGLLTKREVKMAEYWPSSFLACLAPSCPLG